MILKSGNVQLRKLNDNDADTITNLINNQKILSNLRDVVPFPYHLKDAIGFIRLSKISKSLFTFAITINNDLIGVIGLTLQDDIYKHSAEIGYWIGEPYWSQGIGTKAVALLSEYAFSELEIMRLYAGVFEHNEASMRVLEKCGYQKEGISRGGIIKNNQILDEHRYALLKSDYLQNS